MTYFRDGQNYGDKITPQHFLTANCLKHVCMGFTDFLLIRFAVGGSFHTLGCVYTPYPPVNVKCKDVC